MELPFLDIPKFIVRPDELKRDGDVEKLLNRFQSHLGNRIGEHVNRAMAQGGGKGGGGGFGGDHTGDSHRWRGMVPYSLGSAAPAAAGSSTLTADLKGLVIDEDTPLFIGTNGIVTVVTAVTYDGRTQYMGPGAKLPAKVFDPSTSDEYVGLNLEGPATREITVTADVSASGNWYLWTYVPRKAARRAGRGQD